MGEEMERAQDKILLFIPAYNCEKQIVRVLAKLDERAVRFFNEIIVVNNRSTDGTEQAVLAFAGRHPGLPLKLLRNGENYGLGGSCKVAFAHALQGGFSHVVMLHGDDQGDLRDILPLLASGAHRKYDCCLGARFMKGASLSGYSAFRTFGNRVYNLLFSAVCGRRIYDLGSGLNLYSAKMLENQFYRKFPDNLTFNYCMVLALAGYRQSALFFPISWREEDQVSNVKMLSQAANVLAMLARYAVTRKRFLARELRAVPRAQYPARQIQE